MAWKSSVFFLLVLTLLFSQFALLRFVPVVRAQSTFGYTTIGGVGATNNADQKRAYRFQCPENGQATSLSFYGKASNGTGNIRLGIYSDNSGAPNALLGYTSEITISTTAQWWTADLISPVSLTANAYYWLAVIFNATTYYYYDSGATNQGAYASDTYSDGFSDPFGTPTYSTRKISIYCTYTPSGAGQSYTVNTSFSSPLSWNLLLQSTFSVLPSWNIPETWNLLTQASYSVINSLTETFSWTMNIQSSFSLISSWSLPETWSVLTQTTFSVTSSLTSSIQWLVDVIHTIAAQFYTVDLSWILSSSWNVLLQSSLNVLNYWNLNAAWTILSQAAYNLAFTWQTSMAYLLEVLKSISIAHVVDLMWTTPMNWIVNAAVITAAEQTMAVIFAIACLAFVIAIAALALTAGKS